MKMKAAQYNSYGDSSVIQINSTTPEPTLKDEQVIVEVHAASVNPFDYKLRLGYMKEMIPLQFPVTIGGDFSGIVTKVADGVTELKIGDDVYGQAQVVAGNSGSVAELVATNTKSTALKPKNISHDEAASLVLVGVSAIQALEEHIGLKADQKILIQGGAGGIGSIAIQLAKHLGAYVATTVGIDSVEFAKELGADEVIDYKTQAFEEKIHDFDAVFDTVGGETLEKSVNVLKSGGTLVSMIGKPKTEKEGITTIGQSTGVTTDRLTRLTELVEQEVIKPQIDKTFSLDEAQQAYEYLENSHPKGKVVIHIK